ncbi:glycosyl hydrolase family 28-related protein [Amycolatopsis nalaikhensis]|uniref:Glycosyl hydrolase family 28-related protein n=1 Tax=Amycolatopsis nalaikhensis TaxID=715472 RepID=A0ABY8XDF0_9PSEU|nr:glycosyl hydrolase family 28-related protein [Amycolatopsis sp. 2-2]WIV52953.1 glycosyl hydrolase family 28-related protein [Amycolatopsis sp. 2-2]
MRLTASAGAAWTVVDLLDSELVAPPRVLPFAANAVLFGADPAGRRDSADALDRAIDFARRAHLKVYLPPGTYQVNRDVLVDDVTIEGAGSWYTIVKGHGVYGKAEGSHDVHLARLAIEGDVRERVDTDQVNAVGGAFSDSTVDSLYLHHTKVGLWFDGPMSRTRITNNVIADQIADGLNFHTEVTDSVVANNFLRNTGDDCLAMWSEKAQDARNTFDHNTVQTPVLANGIALCGGVDNVVSANLVADPIREGSAIQVGSRFGAEPFGGGLRIADNTTVRAGTFELNWKIRLGAIWFYAREKDIAADIAVTGDHFLDNTYNAIMLVSDFPVKDKYSIGGLRFADLRVDGTGTSVLSARSVGSASFRNVAARGVGAVGVNNCGSFNFPPTGQRRGCCRTRSPATTGRRSCHPRRVRGGDRNAKRCE